MCSLACLDRATAGREKQWKLMRMFPEAACTSRMNWRSVAFSALSGMLLTSPMVSSAAPARSKSSCAGASAGLLIGRSLSNRSVMAGPPALLRGFEPRRSRAGTRQRLVDVLDDVVDVLDADRETDGLRQHAGHALLLRRHLAVRRRGGMAGQRLGVADIDEAGDQLQRVVESLARLHAALDAEGEQRGGVAVQILLHQRVIGAIGQARIIDPGDARILAQEFGDLARVLDMALDAQRHRLDALQQHESVERRQHRTHGPLI